MKILVTGGEGQVGSALANYNEVVAYPRRTLDITNLSDITRALQKEKPTLVVNTAALTAVDRAETERHAAFSINRDGAGCLALACQAVKIPLIHLSTDYVFDGKSASPYAEDALPAPLNVYGASKWEGEEAVRHLCEKHVILRVSGVFSETGTNFVKTILRLAKEKETLKIVNDQVLCPTSAMDIAQAILTIAHSTQRAQIFHYCSAEPISWYDFAREIIEIAKNYQPVLVKNIIPITSAEYAAPAQRPSYSVLDCHKFENVFSMTRRSWREDLKKTIGVFCHG